MPTLGEWEAFFKFSAIKMTHYCSIGNLLKDLNKIKKKLVVLTKKPVLVLHVLQFAA